MLKLPWRASIGRRWVHGALTVKLLPLPGGETSLSFKWLSDVEIMILFVITLNDLVLGRWPALRLHKTWKGFLPLCKLIRMLKSESTGGSMLVGCFCFFF